MKDYKTDQDFGILDIPLSCSLFLEPALKKYLNCITPVPTEIQKFIAEWNKVLVSTVRKSHSKLLGSVGKKLLRETGYRPSPLEFAKKCVEVSETVSVHSYHYAIRWSESYDFATKKINALQSNFINPVVIEMGSGLSPFMPALMQQFKDITAYSIEFPEVMEVFEGIANNMGIRAPSAAAIKDIDNGQIDPSIFISTGTFAYIPLSEQFKILRIIEKHVPHFYIEIKYDRNPDGNNPNMFSLQDLQKLKLNTDNADTLELLALRNSLRYANKFLREIPEFKDYIEKQVSVFLSR